jgi:hypothetical protein
MFIRQMLPDYGRFHHQASRSDQPAALLPSVIATGIKAERLGYGPNLL